MDKLRNKLRHELVTRFGVKAPVGDDTALFSGGIIDSLSVMDLVLFVEAVLERSIPPADINLNNFDSINSIVRFAAELTARGDRT
jgi:acyl carrier protein